MCGISVVLASQVNGKKTPQPASLEAHQTTFIW